MDGISLSSVDIITLAFARGVMQIMLGGLLFYLGSRELNDRAGSWWAFGFFINGLSLMSFVVNVPEIWESLLSAFNHLSLGAAAAFFMLGFWKFGNQPIKPWLLIMFLVFPLISIIAWEFLWPNARYRVLTTAAGQALFYITLQQSLTKPFRGEFARIYKGLRLVVIAYLLVYFWSYVSITELLATSARLSLDYHRSVFSISSLLFMLVLAVGCLALKFASLAARNADLAMRDWQTDLLNRRGFFAAIEAAKRLSNQASQPLAQNHNNSTSLLAIDIDHFKKINDAQGHAAGDLVLQKFATLLKKFDADNRLMARMGGEEFLVTLFDTSETEATQLAEAIREKVANSEIILPNHTSIKFTISIGVHQVINLAEMDQALGAADKALYHAKSNGRNQVALT